MALLSADLGFSSCDKLSLFIHLNSSASSWCLMTCVIYFFKLILFPPSSVIALFSYKDGIICVTLVAGI